MQQECSSDRLQAGQKNHSSRKAVISVSFNHCLMHTQTHSHESMYECKELDEENIKDRTKWGDQCKAEISDHRCMLILYYYQVLAN